MKIIVGIPAFSEEKNIVVLIIQLKKVVDTIIVCNDGSTVLLSTIKYTSIEHPLKFYGIPSMIFFAIGLFFSFFLIQKLMPKKFH